MTDRSLAAFLSSRRAQLGPAELGVRSAGRRRVPGLRREEVAQAAGIHADYYARLEQGREHRPSSQVVEALARALLLDEESRAHLHRMAGTVPPPPPPTAPVPPSPALAALVEHGMRGPIVVLDDRLEVLAANALARALHSPFAELDNLARRVFLDPAAREFHRPWERAAHRAVAELRRGCVARGGHQRLVALVRELTAGSSEFAELWSSRRVRDPDGPDRFGHPEVGELTLHRHVLDVRAHPGLRLVVHHAEPGPDADALALLERTHTVG